MAGDVGVVVVVTQPLMRDPHLLPLASDLLLPCSNPPPPGRVGPKTEDLIFVRISWLRRLSSCNLG